MRIGSLEWKKAIRRLNSGIPKSLIIKTKRQVKRVLDRHRNKPLFKIRLDRKVYLRGYPHFKKV